MIHILVSCLLFTMPAAHDFKMSVCEINYLEGQKLFEVKFYLFQDDLKAAIYGDPNAAELDADLASDYVLNKTKINLDGKPINLSFAEIKEREDQVQILFKSNQVDLKGYSKILISNDLLLEKFKQQTNMVYLTLPGRSKITQIMNGGKTEVEFHF